MSDFIIFRNKEKDFPFDVFQKICNKFQMQKVSEEWYVNGEPALQARILSINESELRTRKGLHSEENKIIENVYFEDAYFCYYDEIDTIFSFIEEKIAREIEEYKQKHFPKYTKFRDIPQLTQAGNWECDFTFPELVRYIENEIAEEGLQMNPDFQRGHIWTEKQQIAFIEFFLRGGKTGRVIYLNNPSWNFPNKEYNEYVCVDGLQRYTAIKRFINNEIPVFGTYYKDYEDSIRATRTMRLNINDLQTRKDVLQWYIEFNAGGTPHTESEINRVKNLLDKEMEK